MIKIDYSVFIQIANFLFLVWILNIVVYKPIRKILRQRAGKIDTYNQRIDTCVDQSLQKDSDYNSGLRSARAKGLKEKEAFLEDAREEERAIIERINAKAQAELTKTKEEIARDAQKVQTELEKEINGFAGSIGEKILGRAVS
jgi:F-type H+-transporting ATPase subunit b